MTGASRYILNWYACLQADHCNSKGESQSGSPFKAHFKVTTQYLSTSRLYCNYAAHGMKFPLLSGDLRWLSAFYSMYFAATKRILPWATSDICKIRLLTTSLGEFQIWIYYVLCHHSRSSCIDCLFYVKAHSYPSPAVLSRSIPTYSTVSY